MTRFLVSPSAQSDLVDIWSHIAADSISAADRFIERIVGKFTMLARNPEAGSRRPDLREHVLSFPVGSYLIFYRQPENHIEIIRVLHGARDIPAVFRRSL